VEEFIRDLDAPSRSLIATRRPRTAGWLPISRTLLPGLEGRCDEATSGGRLDPRVPRTLPPRGRQSPSRSAMPIARLARSM
jgi:hypothetical protein